MTMKLTVALLLLCSFLIRAEPASEDSVKAMMALTGSEHPGQQLMVRMLPALKRLAPNTPDRFWQNVMAEVDINQLEERIILIYQKHLTEDEIQAINRFYQSPVGQKLLEVQPLILEESMEAGNQWGQAVAIKVLQKYQSLHPDTDAKDSP